MQIFPNFDSGDARTLILNCGSSQVTAVIFSADESGPLMVEEVFVKDLDCNEDVEGSWLDALEEAWRELSYSKNLPTDAHLIIPASNLLLKTLMVPHVGFDRQKKAVACEVGQNLSFPISQALWDYHVSGDDGIELEIVALVAKLDFIENLCRRAAACGFQTLSISGGALLDYNAYRLSCPDEKGQVLLINLGASSTSLLFIEPKRFFVRTVALGGSSLTRNLAGALDCSFAEAESTKLDYERRWGGAPQGTDAGGLAVQDCAGRFMERLRVEITRTAASFRLKGHDFEPERILLTGRGSLLPGLDKFLTENMHVPVEYFNPAANLKFAPSIDRDARNTVCHLLSESVGLACRHRVPGAAAINLLSPGLRARLGFKRRKPYLIAAAVMMAVVAAVPAFHFATVQKARAEQLQRLEQRLEPLQNHHLAIGSKIQRLRQTRNRIEKVEELLYARDNWINFFADLQKRLAAVEDVWLEEFAVQRDSADLDSLQGQQPKRLRVAGRMVDRQNPLARVSPNMQKRVDRLLRSFTESAFIREVESEKFDTSENGILRFAFTLVLNPEISL